MDGQIMDGRILDGQILDGQILDGQILDGQILDGQILERSNRTPQGGVPSRPKVGPEALASSRTCDSRDLSDAAAVGKPGGWLCLLPHVIRGGGGDADRPPPPGNQRGWSAVNSACKLDFCRGRAALAKWLERERQRA
jgi:hypothetical protein